MGEVWEGLHVPQQVPVAVKILTHRGVRREAFTEAFRNEIRAVAGLNHPSIVTVLDYGEMPAGAAKLSAGLFQAGSPYIVMEYASRGSVKRFANAMGWRELKSVLFTVLDALAHAHAGGVIHRDLKPANILVGCGPDHLPGIKLTDFGLAHAVDQHEFAGTIDSGWGTPQYMAPEQFRGAWREYGPWTDLYALGVMAFYLTVGRYPFDAGDAMSWAREHQLSPPRDFEPRFAVPDGFNAWILRLMQKSPCDRYQFAADAAWALQRLGDPAAAPPHRNTVSMFPIEGVRDKWMTASKIGSPGETAGYGQVRDDAKTMVDRPDTTRLVEVDFSEEPAGDTRSVGLRSLAEPSDVLLDIEREALPHFREPPPIPFTWHEHAGEAPSPKLLGAGLGLFGLRTLPMVDRTSERDFLWHLLKAVRGEREARAAIVRGPAGTGKTRLAAWLCRRAHEVGSASRLKAMFSPIAGPGDGLSRMVAQQLRAGGMNYQDTMERVETELRALGVRDPVEISAMAEFVMPIGVAAVESLGLSIRMQGPSTRYGLLMRHLQRLTQDRPAIVWFDDVQWGADALAFVQFVLERQAVTPIPVLFVLTVRNEALVDRAVETQLVSEIAQNRRTRVLDVSPLKPEDMGELVRELLFLSRSLAEEVERRCGGNPLFAVQLVGDWVAGGKLKFGAEGFELKRGVSADIPDDLHAIWRERLTLLLRKRSTDDLVALEIAAALGTSVELDEWYAACAEFGVSSPPDLTRELLETGLATLTDYGFDFCHGLFRESLERSAREGQRWETINAACVRMLQIRYPKREFPFAERFASHVIEASAPNHAIEPLLAASRARIERSDFEVALSLLDRRELILDDYNFDYSTKERSSGWVTRAQVHFWQGHYEETERYASRAAVEARRAGWTEILGQATLTEALAHLHRRDLNRAERLFERSQLQFVKLDDEVGRAQCLQGLGRVAHARGHFDRAEAFYEEARSTMTGASNALGEAQCLNALGDLERDRENWATALDRAREAMQIFDRLNNTIGVADCVNDIAELHRFRGELEDAREHCVRALRIYEALGSEHSMHVRTNLALTLAEMGQAPQARQLLSEVRVRFEQTEQESLMAAVDLLLVPLLVELGELELAHQRFALARQIAERAFVRGRDVTSAVQSARQLLEQAGEKEFAGELDDFLQRHLA